MSGQEKTHQGLLQGGFEQIVYRCNCYSHTFVDHAVNVLRNRQKCTINKSRDFCQSLENRDFQGNHYPTCLKSFNNSMPGLFSLKTINDMALAQRLAAVFLSQPKRLPMSPHR